MNKTTLAAMRVSRSNRPVRACLQEILVAEAAIARMDAEEQAQLRRRIEREPHDGFLRLWHGLVLAAQGHHGEACEELIQTSQLGCTHWRVGWYLAQSARQAGQLALVDEACAAVLKANPDFWFAREFPKHARGFYAQGEHDQVIEKFFAEHAPQQKVFVEVGAFDGVHYSNVRRLHERHGWSGVCIEPVPTNFAKLSQSYRGTNVRCVQAAVANREGQVELHVSSYPHLPEWGSDVATLYENEKHRWKQFGAVWRKEQVPAKRLTTILDEQGVPQIDLLSVDAEGHDLEVLQTLDFARFQPQLIVVEYGKQREAIAALLTRQGYALLQDNGQDLFMARPVPTNRAAAGAPPSDLALIEPDKRERVRAAISCRDCDEIPKVPQAGEVLPGEPPLQVMHNGVKIIAESYHGPWMTEIIRRLRGHHEPQEERVFHEVLKTLPPKATMIEAGCFWAYYSMWFQKAIPGANNHLIEPNPDKLRLGRRHFELNGLKGVFTPAFVGQRSDPHATFVDWDNRRYPLPQISVDDYLRQHAIPFVHVLHADIQGSEYDLLLGSQESIAQGRIGYVFLSTHGPRHPACLEFLAAHGFHVIAAHTPEESAAADGLIVARSNALAGLDAVPISKRSARVGVQDSPEASLRSLDPTEVPACLKKLNPHLLALNVLPTGATVRAGSVAPLQLVTPQRFDIIAKVLYARHRELGVQCEWARELYHQHIRAFSNGTCAEGDGSKHSIQDYFRSFDQVLDDIQRGGFDPNRTLVPVGRGGVAIDGSHRIAACLLHRQSVGCLVFDVQPNCYDSAWFRSRGLGPNWCDAIALEYCRLRPDTYVVMLFPAAQDRHEEVQAILRGLGQIVYEKPVHLNRQGSFNLIRQVYAGERWLGDWTNRFAGAWGKANPCFAKPGPLRVFIFQTDQREKASAAKKRIRDLFGIENHSVHINDTHEQTLQLARLFLNDNSLHFLNFAQPNFFEKFERQIRSYRTWLHKKGFDPELFCIDGSAVMAAYGIRESADLDVLHFGEADFADVEPEVNSHNREVQHHAVGRDDIVFRPDYHFYLHGLKFASLDILRRLKTKRNEPKDRTDVAAIDALLLRAPAPPPGQKIVGLVPARNESARIAFCLRALAQYTDAIVYLDDCSDDDTVKVVESLAQECKVERILRKHTWHRDEPGDRNAMLTAGREIGGTHFIVLDADEAFTANCAENDFLRRLILALLPGDQLGLHWIQLWRGIHYYRFDSSVWTWNLKSFAFCDDGQCSYQSEFIHTSRTPGNLPGRSCVVPGYAHGVLHFQFTNWRNLLVKQAWYRCLEHVRDPEKSAADINKRYAPSKDESGLGLKRCPPNWLSGHAFFDPAVLAAPDRWREAQVLGWFQKHGRPHFESLDIWDIRWGEPEESFPSSPAFLAAISKEEKQSLPVDRLAEPLIRQASECFERGDLPGACQALYQTLALIPERTDLVLSLGNLLFVSGDLKAARWEFARAAALDPGSVQAHFGWAAAAARLQRTEEAQSLLTLALKLDPHHREARELLAAIAGTTTIPDSRTDLPASKPSSGATQSDRKINLSAAGPAPPAPREGAESHFRRGVPEPAAACRERALDLPPSAGQCMEQAERFFNEGNLPLARDYLSRALDLAPDEPELLTALGNIHFQLGELEDAYTALSKVASLKSDDALTHVMLAIVCLGLQKIEEFEAALGRALQINPNEPTALRLLADLNFQQDRFKDAALIYYKLLQQTPDDVDLLLPLGVGFYKTGDVESARGVFERVLALQPGHPLAQENLTAINYGGPVSRPSSGTGAVDGGPSPGPALPETPSLLTGLSDYFQPPAGSTESNIGVRPIRCAGATLSAFQALKDYDIRNTGTGLEAAERILAHIFKNKLGVAWTPKTEFWHQMVVVPVECELRAVESQKPFHELKPASLQDINTEFARAEAERLPDIENYVRQLRGGADLGLPLYVSGAALKRLVPSVRVEPKAIYMIDGARRLTASALAHRRTVNVLLLLQEEEFAALLPGDALQPLRERLTSLKWFESYQSIPLLGLRGQRSLRRFDLMTLPRLRDQVVMDFGCNTGQACLKALQAGARQVIGIEGMPDTFAAAQEIARLAGLANLRYAQVNFNDADFDRQIDAAWPEAVDYSFFFSVYRTKELTQRDRLFTYIVQKTRKGIFFEGHAHPKIDTLEYYDWLFETFGLKYQFLGYSEGDLRPLFFLDLTARPPARNLSAHTPDDHAKSTEAGRSDENDTSLLSPTPASAVDVGSTAPLVSAIVSTYADERFMEGRLLDLLAQTLGERLEIIVVDSASPQNEGAIVKRFRERHPNLRYLRTEQRETIYQAWNRGLRAARGRYVTNANADDRLRPDALEIMARELEAHPEVALVYGDFFITNIENQEFYHHIRTGYSRKPDFHPNIMLDGCHIGPQPMWRRALHDELGGFDETLATAGDYEFWCRVAERHPLKHLPEFLGLYLHNPAGLCNRDTQRAADETAHVKAKYAGKFPAPPSGLPRGFYHLDPIPPGRFVNIGMVTYNRLDFTRQAIAACVRHTDFPYVLTVVDNASQDGSRDYLTELKRQGIIKNLLLLGQNIGIARASNLAWQAEPDAQFYLKLDNDIVIHKPHWLAPLVEAVERVPKLGAVGYNFEPVSYPLHDLNGVKLRLKDRGIIGGACFLIPKRTERQFGYWCEDYGLYGEEDGDYCTRLALGGLGFAYLEDENIGIHLPGGKAGRIDELTKCAHDEQELRAHFEYRSWKDARRQELQKSDGRLPMNIAAYTNQTRSLYVPRGALLGKIGNDLQVFEREDAFVAMSLSGTLSDADLPRVRHWADEQSLDWSSVETLNENGRTLLRMPKQPVASQPTKPLPNQPVTPVMRANQEADYLHMNQSWRRRAGASPALVGQASCLPFPGRGEDQSSPQAARSSALGAGKTSPQAGGTPALPVAGPPLVSIIIPTFNNLALTRQCLASLYQTTPGVPSEIIVVDNASTDGTVNFLKAETATGRLRGLLNDQNHGFARACNQGGLAARGRYVLFLNNDTETTPGWLDALIATARETQAGVLGGKLLYPDGRVQHAGIEFIDGVPDHPFRFAAADAPEVNCRRELDMVTGACFFLPTALFLELGGFDESFKNGVEDVDLCCRVRTAGHKIFYEPKCVVYHYEGQSQGRFDHVKENLRLFFTRWQKNLDERQRVKVPQPPRVIRAEKGLLAATVNVCWDGSFLDLGSLSHVNRELTRALGQKPQLNLTCRSTNSAPKELEKVPVIQEITQRLRPKAATPPHVTVRHTWPPNWNAPEPGAWVLLQPWEFGAVPAEWVEQAKRLDEIWVPSHCARRMFVESGIAPEQVHVVPNGIDPAVFHPGAKPLALPTKKSFKFLFVGGTIHRKGPDLLLKAYGENFTAADDVCLVIKDFGGQSVYAGQTFAAQIKAAQAQPEAPEILYLTEELPDIAGLYTACDCLVHPYRGEGFGLPVLEAMACGLPVIVTAGGATDDFATDEFAYRIASKPKPIGREISGLKLAAEGWLLEPMFPVLAARMGWVFKHRDEARAKGRAASEYVCREWTWERAAQMAAQRLQQIAVRRQAKSKPPEQKVARSPVKIELPPVAKLGHLAEARELLRAKKLVPAWEATLAAVRVRPYHPEAFLLLAEIAHAAGDRTRARQCAERARHLAPKWKAPKQFLKTLPGKSGAPRVKLSDAPEVLRDPQHALRLTVCLITKNEERFLGQCLESVRDFADQIVVMDTGSTDWTTAIAKRFDTEVYTTEWQDDFSAARNAALEHATGDWVLFLDADEEFRATDKPQLKKELHAANVISYRLPMVDVGREDEGCSYVPRLFRNAPGLFFVGRVHEQIFTSLEVRRQEWGLESSLAQSTLIHHGYTKELTLQRHKVERNLSLLQQAIEELPGEPSLLMNCGLELIRSGQFEAGLEQYRAAFRAALALPAAQVSPELRESLLTQFSSHLLAAKAHAEVEQVLTSPLAKAGGLTASLHFALGLAHLELKKFAEAAEQMRHCLAKRNQPALSPINKEIRKAGPNHVLAVCLNQLRQTEAAAKAFRVALADDPQSLPARLDHALFLHQQGDSVAALQRLHQLVGEQPDEIRFWIAGGQIALSRPEFIEVARDWTSEAARQFPQAAPVLAQRAEALLLSQQVTEALPLWRQAPSHARPLAARLICEWLNDSECPVPPAIEPAVSQEFLNWYRALLKFGAGEVVLALNQRLARVQRTLPSASRVLEQALAEAGHEAPV